MTGKEAIEKLDHTLCLNSSSLKFDIDDKYHIDCKDAEEMVDCIETLQEALEQKAKQDKILETLNRPMLFSERKKLGEEYMVWARENNVNRYDLTNVITWCFCFKMKEWLENDK